MFECGALSHTSLFFVSFCQANFKQPPFHYYTSTVNEDHPSFPASAHTSDTTCCLTNVQMTASFLSCIKVSLGKKEEDVFAGREGGDGFRVARLMAGWEPRLQLANPISDPEMKGRRWRVGLGRRWHQHQTWLDVGGCAVPPHFLFYIRLQLPQ